MFSLNPCPPTRGREEGRMGDLQTGYKNSFTNNTNNINNKKNITKYTKRILSFLELGAGALASHQQLPVRHQAVPD